LAFKALLILNDAPGPRDNFNDIDQNVKLFWVLTPSCYSNQ
jgi:hypothetical protein